MRRSRFSESQIIGMLKEQETGLATADVCRKYGLSPATFYKLKAKFGGLEVSDARRLRQLIARQSGCDERDNQDEIARLDFGMIVAIFGFCNA